MVIIFFLYFFFFTKHTFYHFSFIFTLPYLESLRFEVATRDVENLFNLLILCQKFREIIDCSTCYAASFDDTVKIS